MGTGPQNVAVPSAPPSHFSFRDDVTVEMIRELASKHPCLRLLDCGCGDGSLLTAMTRAGLPVNRIQYFGLDQDPRRVKLTRANVRRAGYKKLELKVRELSDLDGYPPGSFDLIVVNNILHEIPVESLPHLLAQLDSLLARPHGVLCIVDLEALPAEDPFEPWAFMWKAAEAEALLRAGNWSPQHSSHPKRVMTFKLVVGPTEQVDLGGMVRYLKSALGNRKRCLLDRLVDRREAGDTGEETRQLACMLASVEVSLRKLVSSGDR